MKCNEYAYLYGNNVIYARLFPLHNLLSITRFFWEMLYPEYAWLNEKSWCCTEEPDWPETLNLYLQEKVAMNLPEPSE
jgi:hypothetical protein